jgi:CTP synthase
MVERVKRATKNVTIALVGKYVQLHDAYLSVVEALSHAGTENDAIVTVKWIDSEEVTDENVGTILNGCHGILVPGGFGDRGIEGMITAVKYARENNVPYFGVCLGMQMAVIEYARHVCGYEDGHSTEFDELTKHPVIDLMPDQVGITKKGGTMRLGKYPCKITEDSRSAALYGTTSISERHRHRYEFNNDYRSVFALRGMKLVGLSPNGSLVEIVENPNHPWFVGVQFHPEFKSRPNRAHPLFYGFIEAAVEFSGQNTTTRA